MKKYLLGPLSLLFKIYFGLAFYASLILLFPGFWITTRKEKWYPYCFKLKLLWARILQCALFIFIKRDYRAELPKGPFIIACNHSSYLDIVFMYRVVFHKFIFLGKKELLKWPLFNVFFKTMDIAVDRKNRVKAAKALVKARNYIDEGYAISIFPEGTIPETAPVMKRFKDGAFKLAIEKQVPIVPIAFLNNWRLFSDPSHPLGPASPGIAKVIIHRSIETKGKTMEDLVSLRQECHKVIEDSVAGHNVKAYENHRKGN